MKRLEQRKMFLIILVVALAGALSIAWHAAYRQGKPIDARSQAGSPAFRDHLNLPLSFELNRGQTDPKVKFLSRSASYTLFLTNTGVVLSLRAASVDGREEGTGVEPIQADIEDAQAGTTLGMELVGANLDAKIVGLDHCPVRSITLGCGSFRAK